MAITITPSFKNLTWEEVHKQMTISDWNKLRNKKLKLSNVIKILSEIEEKYGDLDVRYLKHYPSSPRFVDLNEFDLETEMFLNITTSEKTGRTTVDFCRR